MRFIFTLISCLAFSLSTAFAQTVVNLNPEGTLACELSVDGYQLVNPSINSGDSSVSFASATRLYKKKLRRLKKKISNLRAKLKAASKGKKRIKKKLAKARKAKRQKKASLNGILACKDQSLDLQSELCGNSILDPFEECDDGNLDDGDCCTSTCKLDPVGSICADAPTESCGSFRCDEAGSCALSPICSDNDACTVNDTCVNEICQGTPKIPVAESCDGLDNDCDGSIDEGNPGGGESCDTGMAGICQSGTTACSSGLLVCSADNSPAAETCNQIDDDCNGTVDDGLPKDSSEPNDSCGAPRAMASLGSNGSMSLSTATLYSSGDEDFYKIPGSESDSVCGCPPLSFDEDYNMKVTLTVPANSGSYEVCSSTTCGTFTNCTTVPAGQSKTIDLFLDGDCSTQDDYNVFVRVRGISSPGFSCLPYSLQATFVSGLCL